MPTYEYQCKTCGHTFDAFQSMSDAPLKVCPECGKEIRRLINGGSGIIFKGSGFYVTDKGSRGSQGSSGGGKANIANTKSDAGAVSGKTSDVNTGGDKGASSAGNEKSASPVQSSGGETKPTSPGSSEKKAAG
jgi:putative FmdB family regulatory protein